MHIYFCTHARTHNDLLSFLGVVILLTFAVYTIGALRVCGVRAIMPKLAYTLHFRKHTFLHMPIRTIGFFVRIFMCAFIVVFNLCHIDSIGALRV